MGYIEEHSIRYKTVEQPDINKDKEKRYIELFDSSHYSDVVKLTFNEDKLLQKMFDNEKDNERTPCRSDIFFSKTIPIKDLKIVCDETSYMNEQQGIQGEFVHEYRVKIFDDYEKWIGRAIEEKGTVTVGVAEIIFQGFKIKYLIGVTYGESAICICPSMFNPKRVFNFLDALILKKMYMDFLAGITNEFLGTWYCIQIALLHPRIKEVFHHPKEIKYNRKVSNAKKRKTEYIKYHYLNKDEIEEKLYVNKNKKHCLCWYVIGHWRNYKNGNKTFVQGYWKGALRSTKKNYDVGRERVVI